jgi:hypothetical protein
MDNVSYHSVHLDKVPNTASKKLTLEEFLRKQDVYFEDNYTKKQLLEVLGTREFPKKYKTDTLTAESGHEILRFPPYHCIFNPIEITEEIPEYLGKERKMMARFRCGNEERENHK